MKNNCTIQIKGLLNEYDISLDLSKKINTLIGENGVGKSTIINIILTLSELDFIKLSGYPFKSVIFSMGDKAFCIDRSSLIPSAREFGLAFQRYVMVEIYSEDILCDENEIDSFIGELANKLSELEKEDEGRYIDMLTSLYFHNDKRLTKEWLLGLSRNYVSLGQKGDINISDVFMKVMGHLEDDVYFSGIERVSVFGGSKLSNDSSYIDEFGAMYSGIPNIMGQLHNIFDDYTIIALNPKNQVDFNTEKISKSRYEVRIHEMKDKFYPYCDDRFYEKNNFRFDAYLLKHSYYVHTEYDLFLGDEEIRELDAKYIEFLETTRFGIEGNKDFEEYINVNSDIMHINKILNIEFADEIKLEKLFLDSMSMFIENIKSKKSFESVTSYVFDEAFFFNVENFIIPLFPKGSVIRSLGMDYLEAKVELLNKRYPDDFDFDKTPNWFVKRICMGAFIEYYEKNISKITELSDKLKLYQDTLNTFLVNKSAVVTPAELIILKSKNGEVLYDQKLSLSMLSTGEKRLIQLFASVMFTNPNVICIDEPELSFSIDWQERLLDEFLIATEKTSLLLATHSPFIVQGEKYDDCIVPIPMEVDDDLPF